MTLEIDRFRGSLLGLATGDALGTTIEFKPRGSFTPLTDIVGGGPFRLKPGEWTDDTSMALCLAESLLTHRGMTLADQAARYVRWWKEGENSVTGTCFDIGNTVRSALVRYLETRDPHAGSAHPRTAGNGSIMRLAPVPMFFARSPDLVAEAAGESSRTTHGTPESVDACRYFAALIAGALRGHPKDEILAKGFTKSFAGLEPSSLAPRIAEIEGGLFRQPDSSTIRGSGYVVESLQAALWAFWNSNSFREGALMAVNLGDDADTTGAVYGQIAGACYGAAGIPDDWLRKLAWRDRITRLADRLHEAAHLSPTK